jgi:N6-L-threonylcarbamoyladenine synthase
VVPEIAARAHVETIDVVIRAALEEAGLAPADLDLVAATAGPGLVGCLLVGLTAGKGLAKGAGKPFVGVNHLAGHALTARLTDGVAFPYLLLLVSGGHSQFLLVRGAGAYERWGTTIDDALGEAFDKTAKLLSLGFPGGPAVEAAAAAGDPARFAFPAPLVGRDDLDLSFAGLKTAVRLAAEQAAPLSDRDVADICASFQAAVCRVLEAKARRGLRRLREALAADAGAADPAAPPTLVVAGGVAANRAIRRALAGVAAADGARLVAPPLALCGDNGVMIAWAGAERFAAGMSSDFAVTARARWPLDTDAGAVFGGGRLGAKA